MLHLVANLRAGVVVVGIRDQQLPAATKPGSRHKLIRVSDVVALAAQRKKQHAAIDDLISGPREDGDEY